MRPLIHRLLKSAFRKENGLFIFEMNVDSVHRMRSIKHGEFENEK